MILFYLTNSVLDISFGALWWLTKNTTIVIINGVCYLKNNLTNNNSENSDNNQNINNEDINSSFILIEDIEKIKNLENEIEHLKITLKKNK